MVFCSLIMLVGVISFSFANGSLASILTSYDNENAILQEKLTTLDKINKTYYLPNNLYIQCKRNIEFISQNENDTIVISNFLEDLPHQLKLDISMNIYKARYDTLKFIAGKSGSFVSWFCPLLKPAFFVRNQYIYAEGQEVQMSYFMLSGKASFVLPFYSNSSYIDIDIGDHFGIIDIIGSANVGQFDIKSWIEHKNSLYR